MSIFKRLECNQLANPLGVAVEPPVLSWQGPAARVRIACCQKICFDSRLPVESPFAPAWNPEPQTAYEWTLDDGAAAGRFETAFADDADWLPARWISNPYNPETLLAPVSCFIRDFELEDAAAGGRLYISGLGVYRARLNGEAVSEVTLAPGAPDFYVRTLYQTYDVTRLLRPGTNRLEIELADGWHAGAVSRVGEKYCHNFYNTPNALIARLEVGVGAQPKTVAATNEDWQAFHDGPWRYSDIYMGEYYDATREYTDAVAQVAEINPGIRLDARNGAPVRRVMELKPRSVTWRGTVAIVDFGQNLTGRERISFDAPRGTRITVRHGEMLEADGALYTANLRSARATTTVIAPGGKFTFEPEFTFYGFRYIEVSGIDAFEVTAQVLSSDLPVTGGVTSDNPLLNQLMSNILWGQRDNFLDIPTDCPQRDERRGWLGDAQVFAATALFNMHAGAFFRKWLADVRSCRDSEGRFPNFAPNYRYGALRTGWGVSGWADAGVVIPYQLYRFYGDRRLLTENAEAAYGWLDYEAKHSRDGLCCHARFKDWLNLDAPTSEALISTAYFVYGATLAERIAGALGDAAAKARMHGHAELGRQAFRRHFLDASGTLVERTQCAAAMALYFQLLEGAEIDAATRMLAEDIDRARGCHLDTGFLGTPLLLYALSENGELDLAYRLLEQTTYPSWLYPVTQGATTIWERWNSWNRESGFGDVEMNSFNHYAYGAVAEWIYEVAAGIRPRWATPGFREFDLAPRPGGKLRHLAAAYDSPAGMIRSEWTVQPGGTVEYRFSVPEGTRAHLRLPGRPVELLNSGEYEFRN